MSSEATSRLFERAPRLLAEVAHALESSEGAAARIRHVMDLLNQLMACERSALLHVEPTIEPQMFAVPDASDSTEALTTRLAEFMSLLSEDTSARRAVGTSARDSRSSHLALPLVGLGRVVGVLFVERCSGEPFTDQCLSVLTVVAAMLATYVTTVGLVETRARSTREIAQAHEFQQLLVGIVSHDLRNPLSAILSNAGLLLRRVEEERRVKSIGRIVWNAQRATRIINDLLDLTRARLGAGIPIVRHPTDLRELLQEVVEESVAVDAGHRVKLEAAEAVRGDYDADRIAQVVTNLLANAMSYSASQGVVRVTLRADATNAVLEVHNHGVPIAPDLLPYIFDPFRRAERGGVRAGLGLGLYIVQQIVAGHGGRVEAESTLEAGTTFRVVLPHSRP